MPAAQAAPVADAVDQRPGEVLWRPVRITLKARGWARSSSVTSGADSVTLQRCLAAQPATTAAPPRPGVLRDRVQACWTIGPIVSPPDSCAIVAASRPHRSNRKVMPSSGLAANPREPETIERP